MNENRRSRCKNCSSEIEITNKFCPECGQKNKYVNHSAKELGKEFISSAFNFDQKIWQTFNYLIRFPGKLSLDYINGKKISFVPPVRLFLFLSFVFFLLSNVELGSNEAKPSVFADQRNTFSLKKGAWKRQYNSADLEKELVLLANRKAVVESRVELSDFIVKYKTHIQGVNLVDTLLADRDIIQIHVDPKYDSIRLDFTRLKKNGIYIPLSLAKEVYIHPNLLDSVFSSYKISAVKRFFYRNTIMNDIEFEFATSHFIAKSGGLDDAISKKASYLLLIMLPISALLLFLFFHKQRGYFYDNLIFTIHAHSFLLVVLIFGTLISVLSDVLFLENNHISLVITNLVAGIGAVYVIIYNLRGVMTFYKIKLLKAIFKSMLFLLIYGTLFLFGLLYVTLRTF